MLTYGIDEFRVAVSVTLDAALQFSILGVAVTSAVDMFPRDQQVVVEESSVVGEVVGADSVKGVVLPKYRFEKG